MLRAAALLLAVGLVGCASAPPHWYGGYVDGLSEFYDQGAGNGSTIDRADRNAQIALVGFQQGIDVEAVTEDQVQAFSRQGDEMIVEVMTQEGVQRVSGKLPAGAYAAERWQDGSGDWWSFYLAEKPGRTRRIQDLRDRKLSGARLRSVVPGWAQFAKGQQSKGWRILAAEGTGLTGLITFAVLQQDFEDRRDRVRGFGEGAVDDRQYYDDWANRFYWASVAFGTLAGGTYIYNLVDGITSVPPTYRLLLSRAQIQPRADGGIAVACRFDIN